MSDTAEAVNADSCNILTGGPLVDRENRQGRDSTQARTMIAATSARAMLLWGRYLLSPFPVTTPSSLRRATYGAYQESFRTSSNGSVVGIGGFSSP